MSIASLVRVPGFPPLPSQPEKPLAERVAEARRLRGKVSEAELHTILNAIWGSARDRGEYSLEVVEPKDLPAEISVPGSPTIAKIQEVVAEHFNLTRAELVSKHRYERIVYPRHIAMYLAKQMTRHTFNAIGKRFGGRDHTTVLQAIRRIDDAINGTTTARHARRRKPGDATLAAEIAMLKERVVG
jgi:chromosomal replication initiator protein